MNIKYTRISVENIMQETGLSKQQVESEFDGRDIKEIISDSKLNGDHKFANALQKQLDVRSVLNDTEAEAKALAFFKKKAQTKMSNMEDKSTLSKVFNSMRNSYQKKTIEKQAQDVKSKSGIISNLQQQQQASEQQIQDKSQEISHKSSTINDLQHEKQLLEDKIANIEAWYINLVTEGQGGQMRQKPAAKFLELFGHKYKVE